MEVQTMVQMMMQTMVQMMAQMMVQMMVQMVVQMVVQMMVLWVTEECKSQLATNVEDSAKAGRCKSPMQQARRGIVVGWYSQEAAYILSAA